LLNKEAAMKKLALIAVLTMIAGPALADSCKVTAAGKKLAGAAMTSFMKKCESDAKAACEKSSKDMKLAGAAKASHEKKCMADATGM
jgi:hypothetical protein